MLEYRVLYAPAGAPDDNEVCPATEHLHLMVAFADPETYHPGTEFVAVQLEDGEWLVTRGSFSAKDEASALARIEQLQAAGFQAGQIDPPPQSLLPDNWEPGGYL